MTQEELYAGLLATGYPVAYRAFSGEKTPPYICYLFVADADLKADDSNYQAISEYHIELYCKTKSAVAEAAVERELAAMGLVWSKAEEWIETEGLLEILYTVEIVGSVSSVS